MSYALLEAVRRRLTVDTGIHALVVDRVYPYDVKLVERLTEGQLPTITFAMLAETEDPCGRINSTVQISVIHRGLEKKTVWDIHRAIELAVPADLLQVAAETSPSLKIRVAAFGLESVDDTAYDEATNTNRLQSRWAVKYVRIP